MTTVTLRDALKAGLCVAGQKRFFAAHGLNFSRFIQEGMPIEMFNGISDLNLERAFVLARERENEGAVDGRG